VIGRSASLALALAASAGCRDRPQPSASAARPSALAASPPSASAVVADARPHAPGSSDPARRAPPPPLEPARADAQLVMSCLSDVEPTVCPFWESELDVATTRKAKHDCEGADRTACLVEGIGAIGRGDLEEAAASLVKSCEAEELLACTYLAYAHLVCSRNAMKGGGTCNPTLENHYDDKRSEAVLVRACDGGLGSACLVLGKIYWARTDNAMPWLERACRWGMLDGCRAIYDELRDVTKYPAPPERRLAWVRIRLMELCDANAVSCYDIAAELAEMTHMPRSEFTGRACDPKRIPHMPASKCKKEPSKAGASASAEGKAPGAGRP
jgi:hypothetical protein